MCTGRVREAIKHFTFIKPASLGLRKALDMLKEKFGQRHIVVKAHLDAVVNGPPVRLERESLEKFGIDLNSCKIVMDA